MNTTEKTYPIFKAQIDLVVDGEHDPKYPTWSEGLPAGRVRDRILAITGFPYNPTDTEIKQRLDDIREQSLDRDRGSLPKLRDLHPEIVSESIVYDRHDTWIDSWFSHYTFNTALSDGELLASFARYVDRHLQDHYAEKFCLMGAEDAFRWRGPCRCDGCRERGIVKIDH